MNYLSVYNQIIAKAKLRNTAKGGSAIVETHHIIPTHCGGSNTTDNKVNLTLREHYIAHVLLERIYRNTPYHAGMCRAVVAMNKRGGVSSRLYALIREQHIANLRKQTISEEQKQAISRANKGNTYGVGRKNSPEHTEALRQSRLGSKHSQETKDKWSKIRKGRPAVNKGEKGELSPLFGILKPTVKCPYCEATGGKPSMTRWHFENCKFIKTKEMNVS